MLKNICCCLLILVCGPIPAQNLIVNGGFEDINICREYIAPCAPEAWFRIPSPKPEPTGNLPKPVKGKRFGIVVLENFEYPVIKRSYLYTWLPCPLEKGASYKLSFYLNAARKKSFRLGVCVTNQRIKPEDYLLQNKKPTLLLNEASVTEQAFDGWQKVAVVFKATGEESYISFGNFNPNPVLRGKKDKRRVELKCLLDQVELVALDKSYQPCADLEENTKKLYAFDDRHTDTLPVFSAVLPAVTTAETLDTLEAAYDEPIADTVAAPVYTFIIPDIGFEFGKYALNPAADPLLETCAAQIAARRPREVTIEGYTDNVGTEPFNLELSLKRAAEVRNWFMTKHGLPNNLFTVQGLGESNPIETNDTPAGRQVNRRVEIKLIQ
jgi:outer membrane protein OmpA-like peptidoglycan-associated protein